MFMKLNGIAIFAFIINTTLSYGQEIKVGVEPFPPLINENGSGYAIEMLKEIEKQSDIKFQISFMPYNRAKLELENGGLDIIGLTPQGKEDGSFYVYAQDIEWGIPSPDDVYMIEPVESNMAKLKELKPIGTPRGNEELYMNILGIPKENFSANDIEASLKMLQAGRIKAFIFARVPSMQTIKKINADNIYYQYCNNTTQASFAVRKNSGDKLKKKIDELIKKIDTGKIFKSYIEMVNLPPNGIVKVR